MKCPVCGVTVKPCTIEDARNEPVDWTPAAEGMWRHWAFGHEDLMMQIDSDTAICPCGFVGVRTPRFCADVFVCEHWSKMAADEARDHIVMFQLGATVRNVDE